MKTLMVESRLDAPCKAVETLTDKHSVLEPLSGLESVVSRLSSATVPLYYDVATIEVV